MPHYKITLKDKVTGEASEGEATSPLNVQDLVRHITETCRQHDLIKVDRIDKIEPPYIAPVTEPDPTLPEVSPNIEQPFEADKPAENS